MTTFSDNDLQTQLQETGDIMKSLHFEHESKRSRTNVVITIIAIIALVCIGLGCSYVMQQSGSDTQTAQTVR